MIPNRHFTNYWLAGLAKIAPLFLFLLSAQNLSAQCTNRAGRLGHPQVHLSEQQIILKADFRESPVITKGYFNWFVLARGEGQLIEQLGTSAAFEVEKEGLFSIHSLVFSPEEINLRDITFGKTTVVDLAEMVLGVEGCSDFDFEGSAVEILGPSSLCGVYAGQLKAEGTICLDDSLTQINASEYLPAILPEGFVQVFLLSEGDSSMTITGYNEVPDFVVPRQDSFRIHSFAYDTTTFNLDSVRFDSTTIADIQSLLEQGGSSICADLDTSGVLFFPLSCLPACTATAGSLLAGEQDCLSDGTKRIEAQVDEPPVVPEGYSVTYLLSSGSDLLIRGLSNTPSFILEGEGVYTIHTLVYDPLSMSTDSIVVGQTKAGEILAQLIQGGGGICGALDVTGATLELDECPCQAEFGILEPSDACLSEQGTALEATVHTKATVPEGYKQLFILTSGVDLIMEAFSNEPYFEIDQAGTFRIHNLVYNPGSLPLGWIQFGKTSLNLLNSFLLQGGGDICAALDVKGALFEVDACSPELLTPITFPNPVQDQLNVVLPDYLNRKAVSLQLIDGLGNIKQIRVLDQGLEKLSLNVSGLPEGWYSVRILYGDGRVGISKVHLTRSY